jgi:hypothetical protein
MVRENDGSGAVALRVVLAMATPGADAEWAVSRARWIAEEGLRRGWQIHLATVEPIGEPPAPPPLDGDLAALPPAPGRTTTVDARVKSVREINRRLAAAMWGLPVVGRWPGATRVVSPDGDTWL